MNSREVCCLEHRVDNIHQKWPAIQSLPPLCHFLRKLRTVKLPALKKQKICAFAHQPKKYNWEEPFRLDAYPFHSTQPVT